MGHNLDDFIKNKLEGGQREFELKDAYWMDAMQLIEEDEKRKKRRFFFLLLSAAVLFIAVSVAGYYIYNKNSATQIEVTQHAEARPKTETTHSTDKRTQLDNKVSKKEETNNKQNIAEPSIPKTDDTTVKPTTNTNTRKDVDNKQSRASTKTSNAKNSYKSNRPIAQSSNTSIRKDDATNNSVVYQSTEPITNNAGVEPTKSYTTTNSTITTNSSTSQSDAKPTTEEINFEAVRKPNLREDQQPTTLLKNSLKKFPKPFASVTAENTPKIEDLPALILDNMSDDDKETPSIKRLSAGVRGSALFYLSPADAQQQVYVGSTAGLSLKYLLSRNLSINADALYHVRNFDFSHVGSAETVTYGFGRLANQKVLTPQAIHSIEVPIYMELGLGRASDNLNNSKRYYQHAIEAGFAPVFQYGVKGALISNNDGQETVEEEGWIDTEAYKTPRFNALLGYNFYINPHIGLGIRTRYAIKGIRNEQFETPHNVTPTYPSNFYLGINAKFYLF